MDRRLQVLESRLADLRSGFWPTQRWVIRSAKLSWRAESAFASVRKGFWVAQKRVIHSAKRIWAGEIAIAGPRSGAWAGERPIYSFSVVSRARISLSSSSSSLSWWRW